MRLNRRFIEWGLLTLAVWSVIALFSASPSCAADPSFVGVLSLAVDDQVASQLGLSDEVREKLRRHCRTARKRSHQIGPEHQGSATRCARGAAGSVCGRIGAARHDAADPGTAQQVESAASAAYRHGVAGGPRNGAVARTDCGAARCDLHG